MEYATINLIKKPLIAVYCSDFRPCMMFMMEINQFQFGSCVKASKIKKEKKLNENLARFWL